MYLSTFYSTWSSRYCEANLWKHHEIVQQYSNQSSYTQSNLPYRTQISHSRHSNLHNMQDGLQVYNIFLLLYYSTFLQNYDTDHWESIQLDKRSNYFVYIKQNKFWLTYKVFSYFVFYPYRCWLKRLWFQLTARTRPALLLSLLCLTPDDFTHHGKRLSLFLR